MEVIWVLSVGAFQPEFEAEVLDSNSEISMPIETQFGYLSFSLLRKGETYLIRGTYFYSQTF